MTWRDKITANSAGGKMLRGSFRGAEFQVRSNDLDFGRRTQAHEYPLRDTPYVEDLGLKGRRFQIEVFVAGLDYTAARDRLIVEIEKRGPGALVHPYHGTRQVAILEARVRESSREGGMATFTLTCMEAGELTYPTTSTDTPQATQDKAETARQASLADFVRKFKIENLPGWSVTQLQDEVTRQLGDITGVVGDVAGSIAAQIRAPDSLGAAIQGAIASVRDLVGAPARAMGVYSSLSTAGADSPAIPQTTTTRRQQAQDAAALTRLTRETAAIEAAETSAAMEFASADDALATRSEVLGQLDACMEATDPVTGAPIDDEVFDALRGLRAATAEDLRVRGARLPKIARVTQAATLPAGVVAYKIYGDASRADEIVARNKIRHPGFVPGGRELEVLSDG
jgi:prophage DNA circulation protein